MLLAFSVISFLKGVLMFLFILSALFLTLVILLQEPKGGGLSSAFGGVGAETFGVQTGGINRFTAYVAAIWVGAAIFYASIRPDEESAPTDATRTAPAEPAGGADETGPPPGDEGEGGD